MKELEGNDEERSKVIADFYLAYRPIQKKHNLRMHSRFSLFEKESLIEIWEYNGVRKGKRICSVKEESEIGCYRRAKEEIESYAANKKGGVWEDNIPEDVAEKLEYIE